MASSPDALTCMISRRGFFGYGVGVLILAYGGFGMVTGFIAADPQSRGMQIGFGLVFLALALGTGLILFRLFRMLGREVLTIDANGVWDRRLTQAPIPWSAIESIERVEPSFIEKLVLVGGQGGKIVLHIAPSFWPRISFSEAWIEAVHTNLLAGPNGLRIFHKPLDMSYLQLNLAIEELQQMHAPSAPTEA